MPLRPQEVVDWGRRRSSVPSITNLQEFQEKWIAWWGSCQPRWRSAKTWPFPRDDAVEGDWAKLNVTGPHGLFAVVMSMSWWAASVNPDSHPATFIAAVTDLHWVIKKLILFSSKPQLEVDTAPANKFPGHCERAPGKRQVRPSSKACSGR